MVKFNLDFGRAIDALSQDLEKLFGGVADGAQNAAAQGVSAARNKAMEGLSVARPDTFDGTDFRRANSLDGVDLGRPNTLSGFEGGRPDPFAGLNFGRSAQDGGGNEGGGNPFHGWEQMLALVANRNAQKASTATAIPPGTLGPIATAGGSGLSSDQWADLINEEAAKFGDMPDMAEVVQAVIQLESNGDPNAEGVVVTSGPYTGQRAQGLGQIMPGNYPGVNLKDPRVNVQKMMEMLSERYRRYGNWDKAVASYFGAIDANGNITGAQDDNGTGGFQYVNTVNQHRAAIRAGRAKRAAASTGGGAGLASLFGGQNFATTQGFGRTDFSTGSGAGIYDFGAEFGLDGDSHTGWDIGTPVGTQFYMPQGLSGTVTIAGGSGYYTDETKGNAPGTGEIRITLDNGYELILGHNSQINVRQGQRVSAGDLLGLTGFANGAHIHIEVRKRDTSTRSQWRIVDPAELFGKLPGGHYAGDGHQH